MKKHSDLKYFNLNEKKTRQQWKKWSINEKSENSELDTSFRRKSVKSIDEVYSEDEVLAKIVGDVDIITQGNKEMEIVTFSASDASSSTKLKKIITDRFNSQNFFKFCWWKSTNNF